MGKEKYLEILRDFKDLLSKRLEVNKMLLFGSRARGDFEEDSDFDLIVVSSDFEGKKSFNRAVEFRECWNIDSPVDFICLTPEEFDSGKDRVGFIGNALKEGIVI